MQRETMSRFFSIGASLALLLGLCLPSAQASEPAAGCERLQSLHPANGAELTAAAIEDRGDERGPRCVVRGRIVTSPRSTINFRVDLPATATWSGDLTFIGGGGFDGLVPTEERYWKQILLFLGRDGPLLWTSAVISSDSGDQGKGAAPSHDFSWALDNPDAIANHAAEANHLVLGAAADIVRDYYGKPARHRYMVGHSNGGRAGIMAAQRYPLDYDGILSFAPAISQQAFATNLVPFYQYVYASPDHWVSPEQTVLYERAQLAACDTLDGLADGVISRPSACRYDPAPLICAPGVPAGPTCLSEGQAESIRRVFADKYVDVPLANGMIGYPAWGRGAESAEFKYIFGSSFVARDGTDFVFADNIVRYGIVGDPNASIMTHDPVKYRDRYLALSTQIDATDPDLSAFAARGGKLIVWYGTSDDCVSFAQFARYYESVKSRLGNRMNGFARFYVSPALTHLNRGPGANRFDLLRTLHGWVDKDASPGPVVATRAADANAGLPAIARPLCLYGHYPRYKGRGDPARAESFECAPDTPEAKP
ncbi:tannase/feruloyl esterase family alpha/beta hydrolase [Sphingobium chlorophenolicum]|nr:tannase/feruloyl esterase family alpha/beta hydrolase [Sphingobium chlorophenolicum]